MRLIIYVMFNTCRLMKGWNSKIHIPNRTTNKIHIPNRITTIGLERSSHCSRISVSVIFHLAELQVKQLHPMRCPSSSPTLPRDILKAGPEQGRRHPPCRWEMGALSAIKTSRAWQAGNASAGRICRAMWPVSSSVARQAGVASRVIVGRSPTLYRCRCFFFYFALTI
jgi:hypothetical protein